MKRNFDTYLEERKKRNHEFTVFSETYTLPPTIPFDTVLTFRELSARDKSEEVSDSQIEDIFISITGRETFDKLRQHREFDVDLMTELLQYFLSIYGATNTTEKKGVKEKA